jgi:hypothetical protein
MGGVYRMADAFCILANASQMNTPRDSGGQISTNDDNGTH